ncbi:3-isopropylmalate dehydrogenase [Saccharolobus solfataricus]|uniref:3-isopropylmalate dehydrogenase n=3 Tax=Saccharolobus solfataricus TaxID=2287 RepID=LEU3_SACS2|nr:isocitrate/isopropylmalate dehydrogenase family protein [Saccharolobus solfataricus]Q9UXB2.1 RecName: Full=3-isopropylmalate dehydrogenase; Short=3-IPM-DH; Short=IMDH; AltName: Full=Beta-IPM dehydrogenase [Saccharolobus solfataricus P2]AAK41021.1 3-isopropylmalate dehydrogenase (leuB) [Saccharolobus solfataricus P2]AKA74048.1 3-isopropylmalate dehydrogenase [Saccharolobus solfataricus]AKA76745.1 3-isopropylmalate dehydrogenase [Saccharolobus solfataricus]AKA79439.1 3-isopropylmalate dehydro
MTFRVAVIPGDGIGPELYEGSKRIIAKLIEKYNLDIDLIEVEAGDVALNKYGEALPRHTLDVIEKADMILKGPVGETAMDVVVKLRQMYDMYANIRPAKSLPNVQSKYPNVDLVIVRENTEDLYKGFEFVTSTGVTIAIKVTTEFASKRIVNVALNYALMRRRKVTCVHKANVMRVTDGLFASVCREILKGKVNFEEMYVDAAAANLVRDPTRFDVIVTSNVYGDILSDEASQIAGSLGLAPSANIGDRKSMFEPVHGAAFDIAGKGIANPTAFLLSVSMMLSRMYELSKENKYILASKSLENAIIETYKSGNKLTEDVGGSAKLKDMVDEIYKYM